MTNAEEKLKNFIKSNNIEAEHIRFDKSLHSVQQLLSVTGLDLDLITKTMIFVGEETVAAMIPAKFRVSVSKLVDATGIKKLTLASSGEALEQTGYPVGGMPCFGYNALLVIDPKVLEKEFVYTGGGSEYSIVKISTKEILKMNPLIKKITGKKSN